MFNSILKNALSGTKERELQTWAIKTDEEEKNDSAT